MEKIYNQISEIGKGPKKNVSTKREDYAPDDFTKAVQSFKRAIELDSNYGRAYAA